MQRLCTSLCVALACLLAFSFGQDDVFRRDQLLVYRIGDDNYPASPTGTQTVPIYIDYYDRVSGARIGSYSVRTTDAAQSHVKCTHSQTAAYTGHLGLSALKTSVGFGCFRADVGTTSPENSDSKTINRVVSYIDGTSFIDTATPIGGPEGDPGVGKGYITSVLNPTTGTFSEVTALVAFSGNTLKPYYGVRSIDRFLSQNNWKQQGDYSGDNARALAMSDPEDSGSTLAYSVPGNVWRFITYNTRFSTSLSYVYAMGTIPNDPNGIAAIKYGDKTYYYMTDATAPQRLYKGYSDNGVSQTTFYLNDLGGEYFGITARLVSNTVYIYVTYRPAGASYSELWEFTDAAGTGSFATPASAKRLATSATGQLFKGVAFTPVNAKCRNGVNDAGYDSGVDCGKNCADKCPGGQSCANNMDCDSLNCANSVCVTATCADSIQNQGEVGIDCGGPCGKCGPGKQCSLNSHCTSNLCLDNTCTTASCADGVKNADETGIDCGGAGCVNVNNGKCQNGKECTTGTQCSSGFCSPSSNTCQEASCEDGNKNGNEADVDCGTITTTGCKRCADGKTCTTFSDCESFVCDGGICQAPTCTDGQDNGNEPPSGDCGQWCYDNEGGVLCNVGQRCFTAFDCNNVACVIDVGGEPYKGKQVGTCATSSCTDGFHNGYETDIDCGGPSCSKKCPIGKKCTASTDCEDKYCNAGLCDIPKCDDGIKNGFETDLDCGGVVCVQGYNISCDLGKGCDTSIDCHFFSQEYCIEGICSVLPSPNAPIAPPVKPPTSAPTSNPLPDVCSTCTGETPFCDPYVAACVGVRITPIVQCVERVGGKYMAFFSYENTKPTLVTLKPIVNTLNLITQDNIFPLTFLPGRQDVFPHATFVGVSDTDLFVEWYVDGLMLGFDLSDASLKCPSDIVFQLLSSSDVATLLAAYEDILAQLAAYFEISPAQLNVTITAQQKRAGGAVINVAATNTSSTAAHAFVALGGIEELNSKVPAAAVSGVESEPLPTEMTGGNTPAVNTSPTAGTSPSGNTPSGGNQPVSKPVSGAEQTAATCGVLALTLLAFL